MKDSNKYCLFQIVLVSLIIVNITQSKDYVVKQNWQFQDPPACGIGQSEDNHDSHISPQFRYSVCNELFDQSVTDLECYEDYRLGNPCWINCYQNTTGKNDKSACSKRLLEDDKRLRLIGKQCGESFYCNEYGCCDEKKSTTTTTTPTTAPTTPSTAPTTPSTAPTTPSTAPTTPSTAPTTPSTSPTTPTTAPTTPTTAPTIPTTAPTTPTTAPTTPSTAPTTTTIATTTSTILPLPPQCHSLGNFSSSRDPTHSFYWNCYFSVEVRECNENEIFDDFNKICEIDWKRYIHCESEGFFANPFDCHKFYRCYHNPSDTKVLRMGFYTCREDEYGHLMVWNNEKLTCVRQNDTEQCNNLDLPDHHKVSTPTPNPLDVEVWGGADIDNDIEFRKIYFQNIHCQSKGLFRNPFDCHKFYKCYYSVSDESSTNNPLYDLEFYVCKNRLSVFDEHIGECVHHDKAVKCLNKQVPKILDSWAQKPFKNRYNYEINSNFY